MASSATPLSQSSIWSTAVSAGCGKAVDGRPIATLTRSGIVHAVTSVDETGNGTAILGGLGCGRAAALAEASVGSTERHAGAQSLVGGSVPSKFNSGATRLSRASSHMGTA